MVAIYIPKMSKNRGNGDLWLYTNFQLRPRMSLDALFISSSQCRTSCLAYRSLIPAHSIDLASKDLLRTQER
ncbi:hypothetical protein EV1_036089 [Malus domestica]